MRAGINATCLNDRPSGARQRFVGLYGELFRQLPDTEFTLFEPRDCKVSQWFAGQDNVTGVATPIASEGRWAKLVASYSYWPLAFGRHRFDVFEGMHLPLFRPRRGYTILTIHDIRHLYTRSHSIGSRGYRRVLTEALRKADRIVTVSSSMRDEILALGTRTPVSVVYNGLDYQRFASIDAEACQRFAEKYHLPQDYVLAVGHFEPRKNYSRLLEAMALLKQRGRPAPLVIIGNNSGEKAQLAAHAIAKGLGDSVFLLSGISDPEVRCAYAMSSMVVFASSYEGFGIPVLEAMAAGKPLALSDIPVFRELSENRAVYFPHDDTGMMADSIEKVLDSSEYRRQAVAYGRERVRDFGFDRLATEMAGLYRLAESA